VRCGSLEIFSVAWDVLGLIHLCFLAAEGRVDFRVIHYRHMPAGVVRQMPCSVCQTAVTVQHPRGDVYAVIFIQQWCCQAMVPVAE
jgi:hypothetical protein